MDYTITICSVGDLMICDSPLYASVGVGKQYPRIREKLFESCKEVFEEADIVVGNFETVVHTPKSQKLSEIQMSCSEEVIKDLRNAGFSILNIANNHCLQHGTEGFKKTKEVCSKYGIHPIGIRDEKPYIIEKNGVKVAFLSLCIHIEWYEPEHILYENRIERIFREIKCLRKKDPNVSIIVSVHWGDEFATYPSNAQIALAHKLVDCGVNVILGHHSHVYQGIEDYKGAVIVYGQGNFVSDMIPEMCRQTGIIRIDIRDQKRISYQFYPYDIGNDYVPFPSNHNWMNERQDELKDALEGKHSDDDYWEMRRNNHAEAHGKFRVYFQKNMRHYKLNVFAKMIAEFAVRKFKRMILGTADGRVSSMDHIIYEAIEKEK